jgi:phytanoyl-CoA hydroxylase
MPRVGDDYALTEAQLRDFRELGLATLDGLLTEAEVLELEAVYDRFMRREIHVPGKDFCDMSTPFDTPVDEYPIINCMLPTYLGGDPSRAQIASEAIWE